MEEEEEEEWEVKLERWALLSDENLPRHYSSPFSFWVHLPFQQGARGGRAVPYRKQLAID